MKETPILQFTVTVPASKYALLCKISFFITWNLCELLCATYGCLEFLYYWSSWICPSLIYLVICNHIFFLREKDWIRMNFLLTHHGLWLTEKGNCHTVIAIKHAFWKKCQNWIDGCSLFFVLLVTGYWKVEEWGRKL